MARAEWCGLRGDANLATMRSTSASARVSAKHAPRLHGHGDIRDIGDGYGSRGGPHIRPFSRVAVRPSAEEVRVRYASLSRRSGHSPFIHFGPQVSPVVGGSRREPRVPLRFGPTTHSLSAPKAGLSETRRLDARIQPRFCRAYNGGLRYDMGGRGLSQFRRCALECTLQ